MEFRRCLTARPQMAEEYWDASNAANCHNMLRQALLALECVIRTKKWYIRLHMTIFAIIVTNSWLRYQYMLGDEAKYKTFEAFVKELALNLIHMRDMFPVTGPSQCPRDWRTCWFEGVFTKKKKLFPYRDCAFSSLG